jgi:hypothetical protein
MIQNERWTMWSLLLLSGYAKKKKKKNPKITGYKNVTVECKRNLFFFGFEETPPPESALCGFKWASKTPAVPDSYKRCMLWLELETCCVDLKLFTITPRHIRCDSREINTRQSIISVPERASFGTGNDIHIQSCILLSRGCERRDFVWRRWRLFIVPPDDEVLCVGKGLGFNHKIMINVLGVAT